jgi:hypothetical protein
MFMSYLKIPQNLLAIRVKGQNSFYVVGDITSAVFSFK